MKYLKFEFNDRADMLSKLSEYISINEDGAEVTNECDIVEIGYIVTTPAEYDEQGNETKAAIYNNMYLVDVIFHNLAPELDDDRIVDSNGKKIKVRKPDGTQIEIDGVGVHSFLGMEYLYEERRKEKSE